MNEKAEFAVGVLKEYALENQIPARSTSDLSPMEQWLILRLFAVSNRRELLLGLLNSMSSNQFDNGDYSDIVDEYLSNQ